MPQETLQVLFRREEESWSGFQKRIEQIDEGILVVLSPQDSHLLMQSEHGKEFLRACAKLSHRFRLATHRHILASAARNVGISVVDQVAVLREVLAGHPQLDESLLVFSPQHWRQKWRSRLQGMGLLSLPKVRILVLLSLSVFLFLFVVFRLLPSATVRISPRGNMLQETMNFILVSSGSLERPPSHVQTMPLIPLIVTVHGAYSSNQVGKQFIGTNAQVPMTIINKTPDVVSLKKGTRLRNQAGMVFRIQNGVVVPGSGSTSVLAQAETVDVYDEIIGDRGNVPAGVRWDFPALSEVDRVTLYAENRVPATGGTTAYRSVLQKTDIDNAQRRLEQELTAQAIGQIQKIVDTKNATGTGQLRLFTNDQLVKSTLTGFFLPTNLIGQPVTSVTVQGALTYKMFMYDAKPILDVLGMDLRSHIAENERLIEGSVDLKNLDVSVFDYADDLSWIKITAELSATQEFVFDPLTLAGARYDESIREKITGISRTDALRIIKNLPEVEKVSIGLWPPWNSKLPSIPSNISISVQ